MADATKTVSIIMRMVNRATGPSRRATADVDRVRKATEKLIRTQGRQRDKMGRYAKAAGSGGRDAGGRFLPGSGGSGRGRMRGVMQLSHDMSASADSIDASSRKMIGAVAAPIKTFADFEKISKRVEAVTFKGVDTEESAAAMAKLRSMWRDLGAQTQFSASQAAAASDVLAVAGFSADEQSASLAGTLALAGAGQLTMAEAASVSAATLRGFSMEAGEAARVSDVLANTSVKALTSVAGIGQAMKYVAPLAKQAGVSVEQTAAMIGTLMDTGMEGSQAGTTLRAMFLKFQDKSADGRKAFRRLGVKTADKDGNMRQMQDILTDLSKGLEKKFGADKDGEKKITYLSKIVGSEAATGMVNLAAAAGSGDLQDFTTSNMGAAGVAEVINAKQMEGMAGSVKELESAFEEMNLTLGQELVPLITELVKWTRDATNGASKWSAENKNLVKWTFITVGALGAAGVALAVVMKAVAGAAAAGAFFAEAIGVVSAALLILKAVAMAHPVLALITAIAMGYYLITENWDTIGPYFNALWDGVADGLKVLAEWFSEIWDGVADGLKVLAEWFSEIWGGIVDGVNSATESITGSVGGVSRMMNEMTGNTGGVTGTFSSKAFQSIEMAEKVANGPMAPFASILGSDEASGVAGGDAANDKPGEAQKQSPMQQLLAAVGGGGVRGRVGIDIKVDRDGRYTGVSTKAEGDLEMPPDTGAQ